MYKFKKDYTNLVKGTRQNRCVKWQNNCQVLRINVKQISTLATTRLKQNTADGHLFSTSKIKNEFPGEEMPFLMLKLKQL